MGDSDQSQSSGLQPMKYEVEDIQGTGTLLIRLEDNQGNAQVSINYTIVFKGEKIEGVTDEKGIIKQKIPKDVDEGLVIFEGYEIPFKIEKFDPIESIKGAQQRLKNLGYNIGSCDGELGPKTADAIRRFQIDNSLRKSDGQYDTDTQTMLKQKYGD